MRRSRKRLQRKPNKRRSRIARNGVVPPRTAEEFFAMSERDQDTYADAMHVVTDMRNKGISLSKASREYRRDPRLVLKWARPSLRKRAGRYVPRAKVEQLRALG